MKTISYKNGNHATWVVLRGRIQLAKGNFVTEGKLEPIELITEARKFTRSEANPPLCSKWLYHLLTESGLAIFCYFEISAYIDRSVGRLWDLRSNPASLLASAQSRIRASSDPPELCAYKKRGSLPLPVCSNDTDWLKENIYWGNPSTWKHPLQLYTCTFAGILLFKRRAL